VGLYAAPVELDPHLQGEAAGFSVLSNVYDALTEFDADMRLKPALATGWRNPEDRVWRLTLRAGVRFHDGSELDAADVVFSLERARSLPESRAAGSLVEVEGVSVAEPGVVEIRTRRPYPLLPHKLALVFIVPEGAPARIERPVGTGSYRLVSRDVDRKLVLEAQPEGWRGGPAIQRVEVWSFPEPQERLEALLSGAVDWIHDVPPADFLRLQGAEPAASEIRTAARTGLRLTYLQMHPERPPFNDPRVRMAVHRALDRRALVAEAVLGQGRPLGQMAGPEIFGHAADLEAPDPDPEAVRRLLAEAGYREGTPAVELEHSTARHSGLIEALAAQLTAVGIPVDPRGRPWSEMYPRLYSGEVSLYVGGWITASGDASELLDSKVHTRDPETGYGDANSNGYSNPELDRLIEQAGAVREPLERRRLLEECLRRMMDDPVFVPLYAPYDLYAAVADLRWQPRADGNLPLASMQWEP
jgi:peptide/nickel transport system substrate-binding protein